MKYSVNVILDEDNDYLVTFPDFPRMSAFGDTKEEALKEAHDALHGYLLSYIDHGQIPPRPLAVREDRVKVNSELASLIKSMWEIQTNILGRFPTKSHRNKILSTDPST